MNVIVCSGNPVVVDALSRALNHIASRQTVCDSGLEVLGLVGILDSDLLVLDLETPGMGGLLLISAIRELAPGLPILAVSTRPVTDERALAQEGVPWARLDLSAGDDRTDELQGALADVRRRLASVSAGSN